MAKLIKMTTECIESTLEELKASLLKAKSGNGKITITKQMDNINAEATVFYSEAAWIKMKALVAECDKEVAWNGLARRLTEEELEDFGVDNGYYIWDILVHPQEVTGVTVTTDQEEHEKWLANLSDEEFNNLRYQGHSHVNMGTSPSGTDEELYEKILEQLDDTMFYIFQIWNKRGECTSKIYDMGKNIFFESADVDVEVVNDDIGIQDFLEEAKSMIKIHTPVTYSNNNNNNKKNNYPATTKKDKKKEATCASSYPSYPSYPSYDWDDGWREFYNRY